MQDDKSHIYQKRSNALSVLLFCLYCLSSDSSNDRDEEISTTKLVLMIIKKYSENN